MKLKHVYDLEILQALLTHVEALLLTRDGDQEVHVELVADQNENYGFTFTQNGPDKRWVNVTYTSGIHSEHLKAVQGNGEVITNHTDFDFVGSKSRAEFLESLNKVADYVVTKLVDTPEWVVHG